MEKIIISVITVCLNARDTIEKTILSVLGQSYDEVEYIIIDGGSTDGTLDIIQKYREEISFFVSEPDNGLYNAMNKGTGYAKGKYIHFLNADDYFCDTEVLSDVVIAIGNDEYLEIIYGNILLLDQDGGITPKLAPRKLSRKTYMMQGLCHQALFVSHNLLQQTGGFSEKYKVISDGDWLISRVKEGVKSKHVDRNIVVYRLGGFCSTANCWRAEKKEFLRNHYSLLENFLWRKLPQILGR